MFPTLATSKNTKTFGVACGVGAYGSRLPNSLGKPCRRRKISFNHQSMRKIALWALLLVAVGAVAQSNKSNAISIRIKKEVKPALIEMVPGSIAFGDAEGNQALDGGET